MSYKTYEKYKNSNVEWIGDIPIHWQTNRFKIVFSYSKGKNPQTFFDDPGEGLAPYLSMEYLRNDIAPTYVPIKECPLKANNGDLLLLWDGSNAGEFVVSKEGLVSSTMAKLKPNIIIDNDFYKYVCKAFELLLRELTIGMGVPHVSSLELNNILLPAIPLEEQKQIANYLDQKTAKIDATIAKNEELIELLEEKRVALINQVVTKGLNPDVTMKDSGIEWIGEIPENWATIKGKHIFRIYGNSINERDIEYEFNEDLKPIFFYKVDDMNLNKDSLYMSDEIENKYTSVILPSIPKNSILIPKRGAAIATNKVKITLNNCFIDSNIMALNTEYDSKFFAYFILGRGLWDIADVSSVPQINNKHINYLDFVLPPLNEQQAISKYLETELKKINLTIKKIEENISLLDEYKTSLIHHAGTGKIDVRGEEI